MRLLQWLARPGCGVPGRPSGVRCHVQWVLRPALSSRPLQVDKLDLESIQRSLSQHHIRRPAHGQQRGMTEAAIAREPELALPVNVIY